MNDTVEHPAQTSDSAISIQEPKTCDHGNLNNDESPNQGKSAQKSHKCEVCGKMFAYPSEVTRYILGRDNTSVTPVTRGLY